MPATYERVTREAVEEHIARLPAILTPTIPGRELLLAQASESVALQTVPCAHHVKLDTAHLGPAYNRNWMLDDLRCEYVGFLDDDDLLFPDHVEALTRELDAGADLAFSWCQVITAAGVQPPAEIERVEAWDDYARGIMLTGRNLIPVTVMARREAIIDAGGFDIHDHAEDYGLWLRMLDHGARFSVVPRETWTYRLLGQNRTWSVR